MWPDPLLATAASALSLPSFVLSGALAAPALLVLLYPAALWALGRLSPFRGGAVGGEAAPGEGRPSVALVTVASARDARLERKIAEFSRLAAAFAPVSERIVGLDGVAAPAHELGSGERVADEPLAPLLWVGTETRRGKNAVLGEIHALARADILLFSDVDAEVDAESLGTLLAAFADETVGAVTGRRHIVDGTRFGSAQAGYGDLDSLIRALEMRCLGSVTSCDGKLYAIRRSCLGGELPGDVTDDLYTGLGAVAAGRRLVSAPTALARIGRPARDTAHELERRRRVTTRGLSTLWHRRAVLDPRRHGRYALALFVNKVLRRVAAPCAVLAALVLIAAALTLPAAGAARATLASLLPLLLAGALAVTLIAVARGRGAALAYLALGLLGMTLGVIDYLRGKRVTRWEPRKQDGAGSPGAARHAPALAVLASHYPKLTETFVIDEVRGLSRSFDVSVHPISPASGSDAAARAVPGQRIVREHPARPGGAARRLPGAGEVAPIDARPARRRARRCAPRPARRPEDAGADAEDAGDGLPDAPPARGPPARRVRQLLGHDGLDARPIAEPAVLVRGARERHLQVVLSARREGARRRRRHRHLALQPRLPAPCLPERLGGAHPCPADRCGLLPTRFSPSRAPRTDLPRALGRLADREEGASGADRGHRRAACGRARRALPHRRRGGAIASRSSG